MKKRYYDYDALCGAMHDVVLENGAKHRCIDAGMILDLPKADVVERKKAEWEICGSFDDLIRCSNCRFIMPMIAERFNFCPDCGADMRKEKTDDRMA